MLWATKKRQRTQKSKWERIQREGAMAGLSRQMFPPHYLSLHLSSADSKRDPFPMGGLTWKSRTRMGKIWEPDRWFTTRTLTEPPTPQPMRFLSPQAYCIGSQALIRRLLAEQRLGASWVNYTIPTFNSIRFLTPEVSISILPYAFKRHILDQETFFPHQNCVSPDVSHPLSLRGFFQCFYGQSTFFWWILISLDMII